MNVTQNVTLASFKICYMLLSKQKPLSEGPFFKECLIESMNILLANHRDNEIIMSKINSLQLSRQTVTRRAEEIAAIIRSKIKFMLEICDSFSLCIDESADIKDRSQLVSFFRISIKGQIIDHIFDLQPLTDTTTAQDIFDSLSDTLSSYGKRFEDIHSITTDGASNMRGIRNGLVAKIKEINPKLISIHCVIHQESLIAQKSFPQAKQIADKVMSIINKCISAGSLRHRKFQKFLEDNDSDIKNIQKMQQVRWLSLANTLKSFLPCVELIDQFLKSQNPPIVFEELSDDEWIEKICFMTDLTSQFSKLNLSLQGNFLYGLIVNLKL